MRTLLRPKERKVVQDVGERVCSGCGAQNKEAATFCWRCYAAMTPTGGSQVLPGHPLPSAPPFRMPAPLFEASAPPRRDGVPLLIWLTAGAVVVAAIAWLLIGRLSGGPKLPDSVGGFQRIEVPYLKEAVEAAKTQPGLPSDIELDIGVYGGTPTSPRLMLMWATSDQLGDADAAFVGLASGLGVPSEAQGFKTFTRGNRSFVCVTSADLGVATPMAMDMCMWPDGDTIWVLADYDPGPTVDATLDLADEVARQNA
ncbi:MAG: hypothetical protein AB1551_03015 [Actinomycetota bacterium]